MIFGRMVHKLVLEEEEFDSEYVVQNVSGPSSSNQQAFAECVAAGIDLLDAYQQSYSGSKLKDPVKAAQKDIESARQLEDELGNYIHFLKTINDREVVSQSDYEMASQMREAVWKNDAARYLFEETEQTEERIEWEYMGFKWVGYIDANGPNLFWDLKTASDAHPRKMMFEIKQRKYHWQSAHYATGGNMRHKDSYICAVDRNCNVSVTRIKKTTRAAAEKEIQEYIARFKACAFSGDWGESYNYHAFNRDGIFEY